MNDRNKMYNRNETYDRKSANERNDPNDENENNQRNNANVFTSWMKCLRLKLNFEPKVCSSKI